MRTVTGFRDAGSEAPLGRAGEKGTKGTVPLSEGDSPLCPLFPRTPLPVHHRAVVLVVGLAVAPVVADLSGHGVVVQLDPQARPGRQVDVAVAHHERPFEIALAQVDLLLAQ